MLLVNFLTRVMLFCLFPLLGLGHGVTSTTAQLEVRPNNLVELKVQFDLIELLNHHGTKYTLAQVAALKPETFGVLYREVIKLFNKRLKLKVGNSLVKINKRYPSAEQVLNLLKRELIHVNFSSPQKETPYTFSDRRYYQQFYLDFRANIEKDLGRLQVEFPKELGNVYVTLSTSVTRELHKGETWKPNEGYSHH